MSGPDLHVTVAAQGGYCQGRCWIGTLDAGDGAVIVPLPARGSALRRLALELHQACVQQVAKERGLARRQDQDAEVPGHIGEGDLEAGASAPAAFDRADSLDFRGFGFPEESHLNFSVAGLEPPGSGGGVAGAGQLRPGGGPEGLS